MGHIAEKEYSIHYYEIDYKKRCLITSLLNYLQDLAILQSDRLGAGIDYLGEHKMAWVLYRWDVKINQYPMYREKIRIRTNPCSFVSSMPTERLRSQVKTGRSLRRPVPFGSW